MRLRRIAGPPKAPRTSTLASPRSRLYASTSKRFSKLFDITVSRFVATLHFNQSSLSKDLADISDRVKTRSGIPPFLGLRPAILRTLLFSACGGFTSKTTHTLKRARARFAHAHANSKDQTIKIYLTIDLQHAGKDQGIAQS